jgi:hypothetical protein
MHTFLSIAVALAVLLVVFVGWLTPSAYRWRVTARAPLWLGMIALDLVLTLIGFFLCAIASSAPVKDADGITRMHWRWWCMWPWDNEEDGVDGCPILADGKLKNPNWIAATFGWSTWRRRWVWSAWRNSVNNLRFTAIGRSPGYPDPPKGEFAYLTAGAKFWLCVPITTSSPWRELWLGWKPGAGFKSTITSLAKPGA